MPPIPARRILVRPATEPHHHHSPWAFVFDLSFFSIEEEEELFFFPTRMLAALIMRMRMGGAIVKWRLGDSVG